MPANPKRVRFAEYDWVVKQSKSGGVCPFCGVLHSPSKVTARGST